MLDIQLAIAKQRGLDLIGEAAADQPPPGCRVSAPLAASRPSGTRSAAPARPAAGHGSPSGFGLNAAASKLAAGLRIPRPTGHPSNRRKIMRVSHIVFDVNDIDGTPAFWAAVLDLKETTRSPDWVDLEPVNEGGPVLSFQLVPEGKVVKNRLHLHVAAPDVPAAQDVGAVAGQRGEPAAGRPRRPLADLARSRGNELCLVAGSATATLRPRRHSASGPCPGKAAIRIT